MRFNWKSIRQAALAGAIAVAGAGCTGINATHSVSPATFLVPGLMQNTPVTALPVNLARIAPTDPALVTAH